MHAIPIVCVLAAATFPAFLPSDPGGVYAVLDKVVLQPDNEKPTSIELQGAFALAEGLHGQYYRAPRIGVMRFKLGKDAEASVKEWRDLVKVAGTGKFVAFGSRYEMLVDGAAPAQIESGDKPAQPAASYANGWGVHVCDNVNYGPARELSLLPRCLPVDLGKEKRQPQWPERPVVFSCTNCAAADGDLGYVFAVETSDGDRCASGIVTPGKGLTTWTVNLALQVGEKVTWSVHAVGSKVARAPLATDGFVVPASAIERRQ